MSDNRESDALEALAQVNARITRKNHFFRKNHFLRSPLWKTAAGIALLAIFLAGGILAYRPYSDSLFNRYKVVETLPGKKQRVILPDSTIVYLNHNRSIRFPKKLNDARREDLNVEKN